MMTIDTNNLLSLLLPDSQMSSLYFGNLKTFSISLHVIHHLKDVLIQSIIFLGGKTKTNLPP